MKSVDFFFLLSANRENNSDRLMDSLSRAPQSQRPDFLLFPFFVQAPDSSPLFPATAAAASTRPDFSSFISLWCCALRLLQQQPSHAKFPPSSLLRLRFPTLYLASQFPRTHTHCTHTGTLTHTKKRSFFRAIAQNTVPVGSFVA